MAHPFFFLHYSALNGSVTSFKKLGNSGTPLVSMVTSCDHIFLTGSLPLTSSGVSFANNLYVNGISNSQSASFVAKALPDLHDGVWLKRIICDSGNCKVATDSTGSDFTLACDSVTNIQVGSDPVYNVDPYGIFAYGGTDTFPGDCHFGPPLCGCSDSFSTQFARVRTALPSFFSQLVPFS